MFRSIFVAQFAALLFAFQASAITLTPGQTMDGDVSLSTTGLQMPNGAPNGANLILDQITYYQLTNLTMATGTWLTVTLARMDGSILQRVSSGVAGRDFVGFRGFNINALNLATRESAVKMRLEAHGGAVSFDTAAVFFRYFVDTASHLARGGSANMQNMALSSNTAAAARVNSNVAPVPLPMPLALLGFGILTLGLARRRKTV